MLALSAFLSSSVLCFCSINVVSLELIIATKPDATIFMTFLQFMTISLLSIWLHVWRHGFRLANCIPIAKHAQIVALFFFVQVVNNVCLSYQVPIPFHIILKSSSLILNMLLSKLLYKKRFSLRKYASVIMVTVGIIIIILFSSNHASSSNKNTQTDSNLKNRESSDENNFDSQFLIGLILLTLSIIASVLLGLQQEVVYVKFGKHPDEALMFNYSLGLLGFLLFWRNIATQTSSLFLPIIWSHEQMRIAAYFAVNSLSQYLCNKATFYVMAYCGSLTLTMVVTIRKFLSLCFSVWYFGHDFSLIQWCSAIVIFIGCVLYVDFKPKPKKE